MFIALVIEILGLPVLPIALGLYLPIYLSVPIMLGGILRWFLDKRKYRDEKEKNTVIQSGILYSSGLIAGEGIVGIILAMLAVIPMGAGSNIGEFIDLSGSFNIGRIGGLIVFAVLLLSMYFFATKDQKKSK